MITNKSEFEIKEKFTINKKYLFIWTDQTIRQWEFTDNNGLVEQVGRNQINFKIDCRDGVYQKIKALHGGSDPDKIIIILDASLETDIVFVWDVNTNTEITSSEVGKEYEITWDKHGTPLLITPDRVIYNGFVTNSFTVDEEVMKRPSNKLRNFKGHRFDGDNHNWFIIK